MLPFTLILLKKSCGSRVDVIIYLKRCCDARVPHAANIPRISLPFMAIASRRRVAAADFEVERLESTKTLRRKNVTCFKHIAKTTQSLIYVNSPLK